MSLLGDGIFLVAMAWQVYARLERARGPLAVGIAMTVPTIVCLLPGGVVSDRMTGGRSCWRPMACAAAAIAVLAALSITGRDADLGDRRAGRWCTAPAPPSSRRRSRRSCPTSCPPPTCRPPTRSTSSCARSRCGWPARRRRLDHRRVRPRGRVRRRRRLVRGGGGRGAGDAPVPRHAPRGARSVADVRSRARVHPAAAPGSGAPWSRPPSPTCSSSARPRCSCPTS